MMTSKMGPYTESWSRKRTYMEKLVKSKYVWSLVNKKVSMSIPKSNMPQEDITTKDVYSRGKQVRDIHNSVLSLQLFINLKLFQNKKHQNMLRTKLENHSITKG